MIPDSDYLLTLAGTKIVVRRQVFPYEAKWWSQRQEPGLPLADGSPWLLVLPGT